MAVVRDMTARWRTEQRLLDYQARLKALATELTLAEDRERGRLAETLHDEIAQSVALSKMKLECLLQDLADQGTIREVRDVRDMLVGVLDDVRSMTWELCCPVLQDQGLTRALATWLSEQVEQRHGLRTEFQDDRLPKPLTRDAEVMVFRSVRELLVNVVKHARATRVKVSLSRVGDRLVAAVEDDGVGLPEGGAADLAESKGFGLRSIRDRLEVVGGKMCLGSRPGGGTRVTLDVPLTGERR
jgi:signal transduction histidine kinase